MRLVRTLPLKNELKRMKVVLRRLGHLDANDVVQLKGRVACEISTCDELLAVELLLGGVFNELSPPVCAALVSVLVFQEGGSSEDKPALPQVRELCDVVFYFLFNAVLT
jgi:ATP-dependent RNA helicase DOB1